MNFASYTQDFEDGMFWRELEFAQNSVDAGAQHLINHPVSKVFYEHDWLHFRVSRKNRGNNLPLK